MGDSSELAFNRVGLRLHKGGSGMQKGATGAMTMTTYDYLVCFIAFFSFSLLISFMVDGAL